MIKLLTIACAVVISQASQAESLLVKLAAPSSVQQIVQIMNVRGAKTSAVTDQWIKIDGNSSQFKSFLQSGAVLAVQPNFRVHVYENPNFKKIKSNKQLVNLLTKFSPLQAAPKDNPAFPKSISSASSGADPLFSKQWGMNDIGVMNAWALGSMTSPITVAVIDTGVDYTHEDLAQNMWHNPYEIPDNGVDDDNNGYIDDVVGWDFLMNDNKPYDLAGTLMDIILKGANPGHGTHCAGNVAATANNGLGIAGVAPNAKIMALRFIGDRGDGKGTVGDTADAVKAIRYAVDNGAKVLSNSWGSEGDEGTTPEDAANNLALKESIQYAQDHDVLFIAAAGNGHQGVGYDNDSDPKPGVPASYTNDNIISVAAIDKADALGAFSNWGRTSVDIAAPGVKVLSTVVQMTKYADSIGIPGVFDLAGWDGTSMATPHVAGAAALYWSAHPTKTWLDIKQALLYSAKPIAAMQNKSVSGGKLNVEQLMKY